MGIITQTSKSYSNYFNIMLLLLFMTSLVFTIAKSEVITVGDENRWTDGFNYFSWAQNFNFSVGDVLVFGYTPRSHNVYDVTRETFQSCNTSSGVNAMYDSGDDHVELKEAKQYWFICTVDRHCQLGMRFGINVTATTTNFVNSSSTNPSSTNSNSASWKHMYNAGFYLPLIGILSMLIYIV
ncbi:stellacyanin [Beta vulgaris subsp. vulgaris]|uniref:stellacyanin n=1 Tax=Beta vulgaris subsp. vulgaris TaxID=3555 RepID=UPI00203761A5|nr:stellacyanin [Beta vulgaris subsp. vulgaris]